ncbi:DUF3108 domain-containing protein [Puniceicoccales bacterium CK1056]|uniref:DUF3108 domain-containing protein n=1 Tax=Oceanipulchritudo coccoides TaxID=2706888 RepID=A0A6B2M1M6_9BACT|nr:DUF3108 domain-containing protein [Oceanipulchritudo coccoides]NDV62286.1 DUF3108 domain-containing protein [Oceanipulchritudo coccoides]
MGRIRSVILAALGCGLACGCMGAEKSGTIDPLTIKNAPVFSAGEELTYKLGWGFFRVADSTLSVNPGFYEEQPALKVTLETETNLFADAFYKVRNLSTSWISPEVTHAFEFSAVQKESTRNRDTVATFKPVELTARYRNNLNGSERDEIKIEPGTFDPLGIVYFVRCLDFKVGDDILVPTSNGKEFFYTVVHVVKKVKRKFALGKREAFLLEPDIKDVGGVFKRSEGGRIRFYFSADEEKLPLRMESQVAVGSFWAELTEVKKAVSNP